MSASPHQHTRTRAHIRPHACTGARQSHTTSLPPARRRTQASRLCLASESPRPGNGVGNGPAQGPRPGPSVHRSIGADPTAQLTPLTQTAGPKGTCGGDTGNVLRAARDHGNLEWVLLRSSGPRPHSAPQGVRPNRRAQRPRAARTGRRGPAAAAERRGLPQKVPQAGGRPAATPPSGTTRGVEGRSPPQPAWTDFTTTPSEDRRGRRLKVPGKRAAGLAAQDRPGGGAVRVEATPTGTARSPDVGLRLQRARQVFPQPLRLPPHAGPPPRAPRVPRPPFSAGSTLRMRNGRRGRKPGGKESVSESDFLVLN